MSSEARIVVPALSPWHTIVRSWPSLGRWMAGVTWAIADQGLFSASNFLPAIFLARWLSSTEYGAFVTTYAALLLLSVLHNGVLVEPLVVFGSAYDRSAFSRYIRVVLGEHLRLTLAASTIFAATGALFVLAGQQPLGVAFVGMAVVEPIVLLFWLLRRACYAQSKPALAALTSAVYFATMLGGLGALYASSLLTVLSAQILMAAAALAGSAPVLTFFLLGSVGHDTVVQRPSIRARHWSYGKWSSATGVLQWAQLYGWYLVLPMWGGLGASGSLRALMNLILPIVQVDIALAGLLVPMFVRARREPKRFQLLVAFTAVVFVGQAVIYGLVLALFGVSLMQAVYAGAYTADSRLIGALASVPIFIGLCSVFSSALIALERPDRVFQGTSAAAIVSIPLGFWGIATHGLMGAVLAAICGAALQALLTGWSLRGIDVAGGAQTYGNAETMRANTDTAISVTT